MFPEMEKNNVKKVVQLSGEKKKKAHCYSHYAFHNMFRGHYYTSRAQCTQGTRLKENRYEVAHMKYKMREFE